MLRQCSPKIASGEMPRQDAPQNQFVANSAALKIQIESGDGAAQLQRPLRHGAVTLSSTRQRLRPIQTAARATLPIGRMKVRLSSAIGRARRNSHVQLSPPAPEKAGLGYLSLRALTKSRATHTLQPVEMRGKLAALLGAAVAPCSVALFETQGQQLFRTGHQPAVLEALQHLSKDPEALLRSGVDALLIDTVVGIKPNHLPQIKSAIQRIWDAGVDILLVGGDNSIISFFDLLEVVTPGAIVNICIDSLFYPQPTYPAFRP